MTKKNDQIAVICSVFSSTYLEQMITSVLQQTHKNLLLVLRIDGPKPEEISKIKQIIKYYSDPRIKAEYGENIGVDLSRKELLAKLQSPYFLVIDDDDYLAKNCLAELYRKIESKPWFGIVQGGQQVFGEINVRLMPQKRRIKNGFTLDILSANQPYLVRKEYYDKTAGWHTDKFLYNSGAETYLFLDIEDKAKIVYVNKILYFRRLHSFNHSLNFNFSGQAGQHVLELINYQLKTRKLALSLTNIKVNKSNSSSYEKIYFYFIDAKQRKYKYVTKLFNFNNRIENYRNILFSIQCPAYHLEHLEQMIQSVIAQTYKYWELLICFDNPPDKQKVKKMISKYQNNKKIKFFKNKKNLGPGPVRDFLSKQTKSRYIIPIDSDDYVSPFLLEEFNKEIIKREPFAIIRAGMKVLSEIMTIEVKPQQRKISDNLTIDIFNVHQPYLIDNFLLQKIGGWHWDKQYHNSGEDTDLFLRLETLAPIKLIPKILYFKRENPQGITQRKGGSAHLQRMLLNTLRLRQISNIQYLSTRLQQVDDRSVAVKIIYNAGKEYKLFTTELNYFIYFLNKKNLKHFAKINTPEIIEIFGYDDISWRAACLYPSLPMPVQVIKPNIAELLPFLEMSYEKKNKLVNLLTKKLKFPKDYLFSIDILVYDAGFDFLNLRRTIYSLYKNTNYLFKLYLIENNNTDVRVKRYFKLLKRVFKNILIIQNTENINYINNIKVFLEKADTKYVGIINSGVFLGKNWLSRIIKGYQFDFKDSNIVMLSPRIISLNMPDNFRNELLEVNKINASYDLTEESFHEESMLFNDCIVVDRLVYKDFVQPMKDYNNLSVYADLDISLQLSQAAKKNLVCKTAVVAKKYNYNEEIAQAIKSNYYVFKRNWQAKDIYPKMPKALILD